MEITYQEIAVIAGVAIGLFKLLEKGIDYLSKKNKGDNRLENVPGKAEVCIKHREELSMAQQAMKTIEESVATVHNGLNSNAKAINEMSVELAKLTTIIEERIPKR